MDWSLLRPRSKNPYLRDELVYSSHVYVGLPFSRRNRKLMLSWRIVQVYYFAIVRPCFSRVL